MPATLCLLRYQGVASKRSVFVCGLVRFHSPALRASCLVPRANQRSKHHGVCSTSNTGLCLTGECRKFLLFYTNIWLSSSPSTKAALDPPCARIALSPQYFYSGKQPTISSPLLLARWPGLSRSAQAANYCSQFLDAKD